MAVSHFEIQQRKPYAGGMEFGDVGAYEQIDGVLHFAVDAKHPANQSIVDLDLASKDSDGLTHFEADFSILVPLDSNKGNGRAIVELPNRGRRRLVAVLNRAPAYAPVAREVHPGDGFLFAKGFIIASIGWQWDVFRSDSLMGLEAPIAMQDGQPVTGETMVEIRPNENTESWFLADRIHRPLPAVAGSKSQAVLYVRDYEDGEDTTVPAEHWRFADGDTPSNEHVSLQGGFQPGKIYQLVYQADRAPIAGTGLLALRDVAAFLRHPSQHNPTPKGCTALYAWGVSQTGRMLRHYISLGLNQTESGEMAYDGIHAHVGGARRGAFNHRFAQPSNQTTPLWGHVYPYADLPVYDPLTGQTLGLLDRQTELGCLPKIISTNTGAEYWRGDTTLAHVDPTGTSDLPEASNTRSYFFAGTQHGAGYPGQSRFNPGVNTLARYTLNVTDYRPLLRAALINLDAWVTQGIEPPASQHPRLSDGTAVTRDVILSFFAGLPGFEVPDPERLPFMRTVDMGAGESTGIGQYPAKEGKYYPALVSAIDDDGNELAGIRLPDICVPVGSHAGWNPRDPNTGSPEQIVPMNGLTVFFPATASQRKASGDPRQSIGERYADRDAYKELVQAAAQALIKQRYLVPEDLDIVVAAALLRYDAALAVSEEREAAE
jgi:hypothetical protein